MDREAKKLRVLIVDDHEILRESLRMTLEDIPDLEVAGEAASGAEALDACRSGSYDVILLDIRLPDQPGHQVAQAMRSQGVSGKIVALSMRDEDAARKQMINAGADAFVSKADGVDALIDAIRKCTSPDGA